MLQSITRNALGQIVALFKGGASFVFGESREATGSATSMTTATFMDGGNAGLFLEPGTYDIQAVANCSPSGATLTQAILAIGTASGATTTGIDDDRNQVILPLTGAALSVQYCMATPTYRVKITAATTFYPKLRATFGAGTVTGKGTIRARKVGLA